MVIVNRNPERAQALASAISPDPSVASAAPWEDLEGGRVKAEVLANSTSVGMSPKDGESPVPASALPGFGLVFDAVYTPLWTRLLVEARDAG